MIIYNYVQNLTIDVTQQGMELIYSSGNYQLQGNIVFSNPSEIRQTFQSPTVDTYHEVWLTGQGFYISSIPVASWAKKAEGLEIQHAEIPSEIPDKIERIVYFVLPVNTTSLDNVEIFALKGVL